MAENGDEAGRIYVLDKAHKGITVYLTDNQNQVLNPLPILDDLFLFDITAATGNGQLLYEIPEGIIPVGHEVEARRIQNPVHSHVGVSPSIEYPRVEQFRVLSEGELAEFKTEYESQAGEYRRKESAIRSRFEESRVKARRDYMDILEAIGREESVKIAELGEKPELERMLLEEFFS
ncbi:hypothetical protein GF386_00480 [Candidatus Pacearchaeota archaeon]|nr:hypothetical protein [Candidatus Pacearchaeota archaeon]